MNRPVCQTCRYYWDSLEKTYCNYYSPGDLTEDDSVVVIPGQVACYHYEPWPPVA